MRTKRFFTSPVFFVILAIVCFSLTYRFEGHHENIEHPKESFPAYGSAEQDSLDGYVYFDAISLESVGYATSTESLNSSIVDYTYNDLYLVEDAHGNKVIYDEITKKENPFLGKDVEPLKADDLPMRLYGNICDFADTFREYDGYKENLSAFSEYPLLKKCNMYITSQYVQSPTNKTLEKVFFYLSIILLIVAIILRFRNKKHGTE